MKKSLLIVFASFFLALTIAFLKPSFAQQPAAGCNTPPTLTLDGKTDGATSVVYHLKLRNNCSGARDFNMRVSQLPTEPKNISGWTWKFGNGEQNTMMVKRDVSGTVSLNLTVARPTGVNVPDGTYSPLTVRAALASNTSINDELNLKYIVVNTQPRCEKHSPGFEITPMENVGKPGDQKEYTIKVTNNDRGADCNPVDFVLSKEYAPSRNWTVAFGNETLADIPKGGNKSTKVRVTSPATASDGPKTITIGVRRKSQDQASILENIKYIVEPAAQCVKNDPVFRVVPESKSGEPGEAVRYDVIAENKDQGPCPDRTFKFSAQMPNARWSAVFAKNEVKLPPGGNFTGDAAIKSPSTATPGNKTINIKAEITDAGTLTKTVKYVVPGVVTEPPVSEPPVTEPPITEPPISQDPEVGGINVIVGLDGIGLSSRINGGNQNPLHPNRNLTVSLYNASTNQLVTSWTSWTFTYNQTSRKFEQGLPLPSDFQTGVYNVYVEGPGYLRERLPGSANITKGAVTQIRHADLNLHAGNINTSDLSAERVDIMDYTVFISCWIYSQDRSTCEENDSYESRSDLNDDGVINEDDYNLLLREYGSESDALPETE